MEKNRSAENEALRFLARRMRTIEEVRKHLAEREYDSEEIAAAIEEMLSLGYLDDRQYAMTYFAYAFGKMRGSARVRRELEEKGLEAELIENALADYAYECGLDEHEQARSVVRKLLEASGAGCSEAGRPNEKLMAKAARKLEQLGYRSEEICRVLREMRS